MIYSILQLISALTLVNSSSSISTLTDYGYSVDTLPGVFSNINIDDIDDSMKLISYYGDIRPLSNDFLDSEWKRGLNLFDYNNYYFDSDDLRVFTVNIYSYGSYSIGALFSPVRFEIYQGSTRLYNLYSNGSFDLLTSNFDLTRPLLVYISSNQDYSVDVSSVMLNKGTQLYSYQPYHSDSELFDVQYDEIAFAFDLEELNTGISYQDYIDFYVSFSFASRVEYDGDEYTYSLRDLYFGFSRRDYDQPYPFFPFINYYIYSSYYFNNSSYTSLKIPLIYSSTDSYESLHYGIEGVTDFSSSDYITFSLGFEYIDPTLMNYMINGVYNSDYGTGYSQGKEDGYQEGYKKGRDEGFDEGYDSAYDDYYDSRYQEGYDNGRYDESQLSNKYTFANLFGALADTPIMILRSVLGFEVFGTNAMTILMSMVTACIALFVIRKII